MKEYRNVSLKKYLGLLSARRPVPGGGSAAALNAALGAALIGMVANFSVGKPRSAGHEKELQDILQRCEKLREEFLSLISLDAAAYLSKDARDAMDVPFIVCRLCLEGAKLVPPLVKFGNANLASDAAIAAIFLESAFAAAYFNVLINLESLKDRRLGANVKKELLSKAKAVKKIRQETEVKVGEIIGR